MATTSNWYGIDPYGNKAKEVLPTPVATPIPKEGVNATPNPGWNPDAVYYNNDAVGYPKGYKPSSTTISNSNIIEKVIPDLNNRVNTLAKTGAYTDEQGTQRYADGQVVPQKTNLDLYNPSTGESVRPLISDTGTVESYRGQGFIDDNRQTEEKQQDDLIASMKKNLDESTKRQIDAIEQQFAIRKQQQAEIDRRMGEGINQSLLMGGSSRYAPISSDSIKATQSSAALMNIAELDAQEKTLINSAIQAQMDGNYKLLAEQVNLAETKRKEKQAASAELAKKISEENKKIKDQLIRASRDGAILGLIDQGITDPSKIIETLNYDDSGNLVGDFTFDEISKINKTLKEAEKTFPGVIGEWVALREYDKEFAGISLDDYLNLKDPGRALDLKQQRLQIQKLEKELSNTGITEDPSNILAYAQQYAATGAIPPGIPKGTFGLISQTAKELPKNPGVIVNRTTGVADSKTPSTEQADYSRLNNIIQNVKRLKELDQQRMGGVVGGSLGYLFGQDAQTAYLALRKAIIDDMQRMQSGAALTVDETAFYSDYLPGMFSDTAGASNILFEDSLTKINNFEKLINDRLKERLDTNGLSMYGFSDVKVGNTTYKVGDVVKNEKGQQGRINADGSITIIE